MDSEYPEVEGIRSPRQPMRFRGMQRYDSWMTDLPRNISPTDIDLSLHNRNRRADGEPFVHVEYKPSIDGWLGHRPRGQMGVLTDYAVFSWLVLVVEDPYWGQLLSKNSVPQDRQLNAFVVPPIEDWTVGHGEGRVSVSVAELNELLGMFLDDSAPLLPEKFRWRRWWPKGRIKEIRRRG